MATEVYIFIGLLAIAVVYGTRQVWKAIRFRGKMLVTCPETRERAAVKESVGRAALKAMAGREG